MTMKEGPKRSREQQHDIRQRRSNTKKLEEDNKKMEIRLQELKLAMNREKEERETKDGGFWGKGQTGSLLNYKVDTSKKQPSRARKVGVLKDEPIVTQKRPPVPGTMAYLAQQDPAARANGTRAQKQKVPKCGQCEDKPAAVTCQECGEDYCTKCFAVFHLKGALRKHRTIPITSVTPRGSSAQLFSARGPDAEEAPGPAGLLASVERAAAPDSGSVAGGPSSPQPPSARDEARLLLQEMMRRQASPRQPADGQQQQQQQEQQEEEDEDALWVADAAVGCSGEAMDLAPARTLIVTADCKTGTDDPLSRALLGRGEEERRIEFSPSLTYAERLMLKQHRRRMVDAVEEGCLELQHPIRREDELRTIARQQALHTRYLNQNEEVLPSTDSETRVDFQALCDLAEMAKGQPSEEQLDLSVLERAFVDRVEVREDDFTPRARPPASAGRRHSNNSAVSARQRRYQPSRRPSEPASLRTPRPDGVEDPAPPTREKTSARARQSPTPRSARRHVPEVPRPASRRSERHDHALVCEPTPGLRAVAGLRHATDDPRPVSSLAREDHRAASRQGARPQSARAATPLSNRFYSVGPRAWRPEVSLCAADVRLEPAAMELAEEQPPPDIAAEVAAIDALAIAREHPAPAPSALGPRVALRGPVRSARPSSGGSSLTRVTRGSAAWSRQQSIVVDGDDYSSYDLVGRSAEEEAEEDAHILSLEREMRRSAGPVRPLPCDGDGDGDDDDDEERFMAADSLELRQSPAELWADRDDADSLDSLDTARYDDAGEVLGLQ